MAASDTTTLELAARAPEGSRAARRLRREGKVPGIIYGTGTEPQTFAVDARILRNTLAHAHAVVEVSLDGGASVPVMVKDLQRHPVRSEVVHLDLQIVRMDEKIQTTVTLALTGADVAPGVKAGGILNQELVQLNVEALPGDVPDTIEHDVSELEVNATVPVSDLVPPRGVTLLDEPEAVAVTITAPTLDPVEDGIDLETQLVGDQEQAEAQASGDTAEEAQEGSDASGASDDS